MKKVFVIFTVVFLFSTGAFAKVYKVNGCPTTWGNAADGATFMSTDTSKFVDFPDELTDTIFKNCNLSDRADKDCCTLTFEGTLKIDRFKVEAGSNKGKWVTNEYYEINKLIKIEPLK